MGSGNCILGIDVGSVSANTVIMNDAAGGAGGALHPAQRTAPPSRIENIGRDPSADFIRRV